MDTAIQIDAKADTASPAPALWFAVAGAGDWPWGFSAAENGAELSSLHTVEEGIPLSRSEEQLGALRILRVTHGDQISVPNTLQPRDLNAITTVVATEA
ncbi:hypothetical protein FHS44_006318 [Streptosporangium saharense]|uniref:Uncharacterized protein n=1 Tax=Streptosporangium saharense TaxID=1706840 RepID=A0A7W7QSZ4_9ACTN|nr:hypothetical protein [Streptosporangium saharense]